MSIFEACGEAEYAELRRVLYPEANVIILCVPLVNETQNSGKHIAEHWIKELKEHCDKVVPILVVGTMKDLRDEESTRTSSNKKNHQWLKIKNLTSISKRFKISCAFECSAFSRENLQTVFQNAVKMGLKNRTKTNKR